MLDLLPAVSTGAISRVLTKAQKEGASTKDHRLVSCDWPTEALRFPKAPSKTSPWISTASVCRSHPRQRLTRMCMSASRRPARWALLLLFLSDTSQQPPHQRLSRTGDQHWQELRPRTHCLHPSRRGKTVELPCVLASPNCCMSLPPCFCPVVTPLGLCNALQNLSHILHCFDGLLPLLH